MVSSSGFILILIATWFSLKHHCNVSHRIWSFCPIWNASVLKWQLFSSYGVTFPSASSQFWNGVLCSLITMVLPLQWSLLKWCFRPLLLPEVHHWVPLSLDDLFAYGVPLVTCQYLSLPLSNPAWCHWNIKFLPWYHCTSSCINPPPPKICCLPLVHYHAQFFLSLLSLSVILLPYYIIICWRE